MRISSELIEYIFLQFHVGFLKVSGFHIWSLDFKDPTGRTTKLNVFTLFWSFFIFGVYVYCWIYLDFTNNMSIRVLYSSPISNLIDEIYWVLSIIKVPLVFIPLWLWTLKKRKTLRLMGVARTQLFDLRGALCLPSWKYMIFVTLLAVLYTTYFWSSFIKQIEMEVIKFESWRNLINVFTTNAHLFFTCACIFEFGAHMGFIALRLEEIGRNLRNVDAPPLPFVH